jgi:ribosomal protein S27E
LKLFKYECCACGSTDIIYKRRVDDIIDLTVEYGCRNCGSKEIQYYIIRCEECHEFSLYFDEIRYEIVCTNCGLVHAGTQLDTDYILGFLCKRLNLRFK